MARKAATRSTRARSEAAKGAGTRSKAKRTPAGKRGSSKTRTAKSPATTVMGVTIPKTLTNALDSLVNSPRGREILASALVAAASAAAAALVAGSNRAEAAKAREAVSEAGDRITKDLGEAAAGVVAGVISGAARSLIPALTGVSDKKKSD